MIGDFNGDRKSDALITGCDPNGYAVLLAPQYISTSIESCYSCTFPADINRDGRGDLVWNQAQGTSNLIKVALSRPSGGFTALPEQDLGNSLGGNWDIARRTLYGDVDGDGGFDLIWVIIAPTQLEIYDSRSNPDGSFRALRNTTYFSVDYSAYNVAPGDFNGDGRTDLLFASQCIFNSRTWSISDNCIRSDFNQVRIALSDNDGSFTIVNQALGASGWGGYDLSIADLNGDGCDDLVWIEADAFFGIYTGLATCSGSFILSSKQTYNNAFDPGSFGIGYIADINGDGRQDMVWVGVNFEYITSVHYKQIQVGLAQANGTYILLPIQKLGPGREWRFDVVPANLNNDGMDDLFLAFGENGETISLISNGSTFSASPLVRFPGAGWGERHNLEEINFLADMNADGKDDLLAVNHYFSQKQVYIALTSPLSLYLPLVKR
jgi:hypothetical protein